MPPFISACRGPDIHILYVMPAPLLASAHLGFLTYSMDMHWSYTVTPIHLGLTAEGRDYPSLSLGTYTVTTSYNMERKQDISNFFLKKSRKQPKTVNLFIRRMYRHVDSEETIRTLLNTGHGCTRKEAGINLLPSITKGILTHHMRFSKQKIFCTQK